MDLLRWNVETYFPQHTNQTELVHDLLRLQVFKHLKVKNHGNFFEVKSWWLLPKFIVPVLIEEKEVVLENKYGAWWGRCVDGQPICQDKIIKKIAKDFDWLEEKGNV